MGDFPADRADESGETTRVAIGAVTREGFVLSALAASGRVLMMGPGNRYTQRLQTRIARAREIRKSW